MMQSIAYLHNFTPLPCGEPRPQSELLDWLIGALRRKPEEHTDSTAKAINMYERLVNSSQVKFRSSVVSDYYHQDWDRMRLFREWKNSAELPQPWDHPPLDVRGNLFAEASEGLIDAAFREDTRPPHYLVQVSCTGYGSPHASQKLLVKKNWNRATRLLHIGHMGCYAAIPATSVASLLLPKNEGHVSLFLCELCSLHLKPTECSPQQVVMNSLFADGAIRFDLSRNARRASLGLIATQEMIIPDTGDEMTWTTGDSGFRMTLSARVPILIVRELKAFLFDFLAEHRLDVNDIDRFAVHPGGPKIIDIVSEQLALSDAQISHSRNVLAAHGNMSSCSLPHIWGEMANDANVKAGELIVSLAFGPGLTIAANLLRKAEG